MTDVPAPGEPVEAEVPVVAEQALTTEAEAHAPAEADVPEAGVPESQSPEFAGQAAPDPVVARERDQYLDDLRRLQAEFENFRKRALKQQTDLTERAAETLVRELLPVLDVADLAQVHGADDQVGAALGEALRKEGLERLDPVGNPFDPSEHDAVMHEQGDGEPEVIEVMRAGYRWRGRLLRPAMVKVKGG
ncbi:MAG: nucleotide exchange factor GrpE [Actinobacteria bacterium]|nr:nucleotide exchange factor GrpE [Actinomycetota bacterium]